MSTSHLLTSRMSWKLEVCTTLYICTGKLLLGGYIFDRGGPPVNCAPSSDVCIYYEVQNFIKSAIFLRFREAHFTCIVQESFQPRNVSTLHNEPLSVILL